MLNDSETKEKDVKQEDALPLALTYLKLKERIKTMYVEALHSVMSGHEDLQHYMNKKMYGCDFWAFGFYYPKLNFGLNLTNKVVYGDEDGIDNVEFYFNEKGEAALRFNKSAIYAVSPLLKGEIDDFALEMNRIKLRLNTLYKNALIYLYKNEKYFEKSIDLVRYYKEKNIVKVSYNEQGHFTKFISTFYQSQIIFGDNDGIDNVELYISSKEDLIVHMGFGVYFFIF